MNGRLLVTVLLACALAAGAAMYYLQVYAFYTRLDSATVDLRVTRDGTAEPLATTTLEAIDATSSPIRFRACFNTATTADTADPYPGATPLTAPGWFSCFDADRIGDDLEAGRARAVLGQRDVTWGIDRVLALYPDGAGFAWQQINPCGKEAFDGNPVPPGCPPLPETGPGS